MSRPQAEDWIEQDEKIARLRRYVDAAEACRPLVDPMYAEGAKMDAWRNAAEALHRAGDINIGYDPDGGGDW